MHCFPIKYWRLFTLMCFIALNPSPIARAEDIPFECKVGISPTTILPYQAVRVYIARRCFYQNDPRNSKIEETPNDYRIAVTNSKYNPAGNVLINNHQIDDVKLPAKGRALQSVKALGIKEKEWHLFSQSINVVSGGFGPNEYGTNDTPNDYVTNGLFAAPGKYLAKVQVFDESIRERKKDAAVRQSTTHEITITVSETSGDDKSIMQYIRAEPSLARAMLLPTEDVSEATRALCLKLLQKYPKTGYSNDLNMIVARSYLRGTGFRPFEQNWQSHWEESVYTSMKQALSANNSLRWEISRDYDPYFMPDRNETITKYLDNANDAMRNSDEKTVRLNIAKYSEWRWPTIEKLRKAQAHLDAITDRAYAFYSLSRMMAALNEQEMTGEISQKTKVELLRECVADAEFQKSLYLFGFSKEINDNLIPSMTNFYEDKRSQLFMK